MTKINFFLIYFVLAFAFQNTYGNSELELLRQAANQGDITAQFQLGTRYYTGQNVPQNYQEAAKWYRKVAEQGFAAAQHNLGVMYSQGQGVSQDYTKAFGWYRKAAEQGDRRAQNNLGNLYQKGQGIPQNAQEALKWYRKAAEQEYALAQYNLGVAYSRGEGVSRDQQEALKWYRKAAAQDHVEAQTELAYLLKVTPANENLGYSTRESILAQNPVALENLPTLPTETKSNSTPKPASTALASPSSSSPISSTIAEVIETPTIQSKKNNIPKLSQVETFPKESAQPPQLESLAPPSSSSPISPTIEEAAKSANAKPLDNGPSETQKRLRKKYFIAFNYNRKKDKPLINQLAQYLKNQGYTVDRIQKVNPKVYKQQWDIRYYYERKAANELKESLQDFTQMIEEVDDVNIQVKNFSFLLNQKIQIRRGRLEVWILNPF